MNQNVVVTEKLKKAKDELSELHDSMMNAQVAFGRARKDFDDARLRYANKVDEITVLIDLLEVA